MGLAWVERRSETFGVGLRQKGERTGSLVSLRLALGRSLVDGALRPTKQAMENIHQQPLQRRTTAGKASACCMGRVLHGRES